MHSHGSWADLEKNLGGKPIIGGIKVAQFNGLVENFISDFPNTSILS